MTKYEKNKLIKTREEMIKQQNQLQQMIEKIDILLQENK